MRTSRVAKETSKFFKNDTASSLPQRRSTRSSTRLARFAYTNGESLATSSVKPEDEDDDQEDILAFGSDIEDAIITKSSASPPTRAAKAVITGKRKRTTTTSSTTAPPPPRRSRTTTVKQQVTPKTELKSDEEEEKEDKKPTETKPKRTRAPARKTTNPSTGEIKVQPPSDWEEMYALVKEMRISGPAAHAAVDTMGCERLATKEASARDRRFHTLVALMLSSQTKDTVNAEAMIRLKKELPACEEGKEKGLNLENMLAVEPGVLNELIGKVGFHNNKTKYLKQAAVIIRDQHGSDIPDTLEGLMSLPGVGPKMAHLCMGAEDGWNTVTGIGVDVHVHRITNLWGWQMPPSKNPEETRMALESWLPREKWKEINWLLVGFGQKVCLPIGRKCGECTLGLRGLCKAAERGKVMEGRRRLKMAKKEEVKEEKGGDVITREAWIGKVEEDRNIITREAWVGKEEEDRNIITREAWLGEEEVEEKDRNIITREAWIGKEEQDRNIITREAWLVERTKVADEEEVKEPTIKKSIEEDDEDLSFVKANVKKEAADEKREAEKSEVKDEDSSFVKIKDESDEEMG